MPDLTEEERLSLLEAKMEDMATIVGGLCFAVGDGLPTGDDGLSWVTLSPVVQAAQRFRAAAQALARGFDAIATAADALHDEADKDETLPTIIACAVKSSMDEYDDMHFGTDGSCWVSVEGWMESVDDVYALVELGETRKVPA